MAKIDSFSRVIPDTLRLHGLETGQIETILECISVSLSKIETRSFGYARLEGRPSSSLEMEFSPKINERPWKVRADAGRRSTRFAAELRKQSFQARISFLASFLGKGHQESVS